MRCKPRRSKASFVSSTHFASPTRARNAPNAPSEGVGFCGSQYLINAHPLFMRTSRCVYIACSRARVPREKSTLSAPSRITRSAGRMQYWSRASVRSQQSHRLARFSRYIPRRFPRASGPVSTGPDHGWIQSGEVRIRVQQWSLEGWTGPRPSTRGKAGAQVPAQLNSKSTPVEGTKIRL
jgi:hypothetical protein